jgi:hypothetical protein
MEQFCGDFPRDYFTEYAVGHERPTAPISLIPCRPI